MKTTINDVAKLAGVSISTVSHVLNKTRYVRPELVERVNKAIEESGYVVKKEIPQEITTRKKIAFLMPSAYSTLGPALVENISEQLAEQGYVLNVYLTRGDIKTERMLLYDMIADKTVEGIFLVPSELEDRAYKKVKRSRKPFVCVGSCVKDPEVPAVVAKNDYAVYCATRHLVTSGHGRIGLLLEDKNSSANREHYNGYVRALEEYQLTVRPDLVKFVGLKDIGNVVDLYADNKLPTAFISGSNWVTLRLMNALREKGLSCPEQVSVVGIGDAEWGSLMNPQLTTITLRLDQMAKKAVDIMLSLIRGKTYEIPVDLIPVDFRVKKSTKVINRDIFGVEAIPNKEVWLTDHEIQEIKSNRYKVVLSIHNMNSNFSVLSRRGIFDTLQKYGVTDITVIDANYDPKLQALQLNAILQEKPDAIISIVVDQDMTAERFRSLASKTKLIFIGNIPKGFGPDDYYACVSTNERESGQNAAIVLGEHFKRKDYVNIGFLVYDMPFNMTHMRDESAEQLIYDNYPNLHIVAKKSFRKISEAYEACWDLLMENPEIEGLYISWDQPALHAMRALEELGRSDISVATVDLDYEIAKYMVQNRMIRGLSAQRPYELGEAAAIVTLKALLNKKGYKYVGIEPTIVFPRDANRIWKEIMHGPSPDFLES